MFTMFKSIVIADLIKLKIGLLHIRLAETIKNEALVISYWKESICTI